MTRPIINFAVALERAMEHVVGVYKDQPPKTEDPVLQELSERFAIQIVTDHSARLDHISYNALNPTQERICADLLSSELDLYTPGMIKASKVERIVLCSGLEAQGTDVAGLAQMGWMVVDTLFIDADRITKGWQYARRAVHHEIFHAIDYFDDLTRYVDFEWRRLNGEKFEYRRGGKHEYGIPCNDPGFLTTYSKAAPWEDKAELYSHMIVKHADVVKRCAKDEILERKFKRMKELLREFCSDYDDDFWELMREESLIMSRFNTDKKADYDQARKAAQAIRRKLRR